MSAYEGTVSKVTKKSGTTDGDWSVSRLTELVREFTTKTFTRASANFPFADRDFLFSTSLIFSVPRDRSSLRKCPCSFLNAPWLSLFLALHVAWLNTFPFLVGRFVPIVCSLHVIISVIVPLLLGFKVSNIFFVIIFVENFGRNFGPD